MAAAKTRYDVAIIGGGHNGLVAACYLAKAGLSVRILERNDALGGATRSKRVFPDYDARLSVYSYLVSLFPQQIVDDLGLKLELRGRATASYTPALRDGELRELLLRNDVDPRDALCALTGSDHDYRGWQELQSMQSCLAEAIWPSLLEPMMGRETMRGRLDATGLRAWQALIEEPLGAALESRIDDDLLRGLLFTDAKIGVSTYPEDPSLIQNRCFLYHVIGRGTGEWKVPVGGMGGLVDELVRVAQETGRVSVETDAQVDAIDATRKGCAIRYRRDERVEECDARYVLCNASADVLATLLGQTAPDTQLEGSGFKINLLLKRLPRLRSTQHRAEEAFAGTFHINEGYEQMKDSYRLSQVGELPKEPSGEIYCHTLTDDSILSPELRDAGYHTLTLFGLDLPYGLFVDDTDARRDEVVSRYLSGIDAFLGESIEDCLARDASGAPCIEAMSAVDLERTIHLPKGNIFHGDLSWPFADSEGDVGTWGVETAHPNVLLCGSAAKRGGAVSGIPGHNAARCVLKRVGR